MDKITRIGIDLGKRVSHVTALQASDEVVERPRSQRRGRGCPRSQAGMSKGKRRCVYKS